MKKALSIYACLACAIFLLCCHTRLHAAKGNAIPEKTVLFAKGKFGYNNTRIPALIVTQKGTILAFAEGRVAGDTGRIHTILRRSEDGGATWSQPQIVWKDGENTCGNPCPVVDQKSGDIILLSTWNRGDDKESEIVKKTSKDTRRVYVCRSTDDGKTWSAPRDITSTTKRSEWGWYATGPGVGIQLKRGAHKGRLVIPCDNSHDDPKGTVRGGPYNHGSHTIHSDDGGQTWALGGTIQPGCNECQVVELADGKLMMNMRAYGELSKKRAVAFSDDGGATWTAPISEPTLIEPTCQASFLRYSAKKGGDKNRLIFSNPASQKGRVNMTLYLSYDEGKTWPVAKSLHAKAAAYSCLTVLPGGDIGILYEAGEKSPYETITFARVPLEWLEREQK